MGEARSDNDACIRAQSYGQVSVDLVEVFPVEAVVYFDDVFVLVFNVFLAGKMAHAVNIIAGEKNIVERQR